MRRIPAGVSLTIVLVICCCLSPASARSWPELLSVRAEVDGRITSTVRVLTWAGDRPDVVEVVSARGTSVRELNGRSPWTPVTWVEEFRAADGRVFARATLATTGDLLEYEVYIQPLAEGEFDVTVWPLDSRANRIGIFAVVPESLGDDPAITRDVLPAIFHVILKECNRTQRELVASCLGNAIDACAGNVDEIDVSGSCGHGICRFRCD